MRLISWADSRALSRSRIGLESGRTPLPCRSSRHWSPTGTAIGREAPLSGVTFVIHELTRGSTTVRQRLC